MVRLPLRQLVSRRKRVRVAQSSLGLSLVFLLLGMQCRQMRIVGERVCGTRLSVCCPAVGLARYVFYLIHRRFAV